MECIGLVSDVLPSMAKRLRRTVAYCTELKRSRLPRASNIELAVQRASVALGQDRAERVDGNGFGKVTVATVDSGGFEHGVVDGFFGGVDGGFEKRGEGVFVEK